MKIALVGKLRAGKTEVCKEIFKKLKNSELIEFSKAVQDTVEILYPELKGTKDREKLIEVGQHLRKLDTEIWVNIVKYKINNSNADNIIVAGVRQQNEYEMLKKLGFTFIKVVADEETRIKRCIDCNNE